MRIFDRTDINRAIFLSDIHLGVRTASLEWLENIQNYFDNFFIPLIKNYQKTEKVILIIAGDFFDNRQHLDLNVLNIGADIMDKLSSLLEVFIVIGNHDIYKKNGTDISSLRLFTTYNNVHVIYEMSEIQFKNNKKMLMVPWIGDHKEEMKILSEQNNTDFVVMHTELAGFSMDNGREIIDGANIDCLKHGKIYAGHIHKRQESSKAVYLGSPYQLRRSDIDNTKGVYSLLFSETDVKEEFILNNYSPKFLRLKISFVLGLEYSALKPYIENNYVDIIVKKKEMAKVNMSELMEVLDRCEPKKIEVILDKSDENENVVENIEISSDLSITDIFEASIADMDITDDERKELQEMNVKYLALATEALGQD